MKELIEIKNELLNNSPSQEIKKYIDTIGINKKRPLGKFNVAYWTIEPVRGCNLQCGCCATTLFPKNEYKFIEVNTWLKTIQLIKKLTPYNRIDFANAGEPTLHPEIYKLLEIGRKESPFSFFEIITNGTMLLKGKVTYKELFDAGANMIYVDMYNSSEKHIALAEKSGFHYYIRSQKTKKDPAAWTYHKDVNIKCIVFQNNPYNWSAMKKRTYFSTFFNNLNWDKAKELGIYPVINPPNRRCNQPFRTVNISFDGFYSFCCFDFMRYVYGKIGNIEEGVEGFVNFWIGKYMQDVRKHLHYKDRLGHPLCKKCSHVSSRGDIPCWDEKVLDFYYENKKWEENNIKIKTKIPQPQNKGFFNQIKKEKSHESKTKE